MANKPAADPSVLERLEYLETQNEGFKRVGRAALVLIFVLGAGLVYEAWAPMAGITTKGVVLRDSNQMARAAVLIGPGGHVAMVPFDAQERLPVLQSDASLGLRGLGLYDSQGRLRMLLGVGADDEPVLAVVGPMGELVWTPLMPAAPDATEGSPTPVPQATPVPTPPTAP